MTAIVIAVAVIVFIFWAERWLEKFLMELKHIYWTLDAYCTECSASPTMPPESVDPTCSEGASPQPMHVTHSRATWKIKENE